MKATVIINTITRAANRVGFKAKKYAPETLVVVGIAGVVTSTVMACKATLKASAIMDEHNAQMTNIHDATDMEIEDYTAEDARKDTTIVYTQTAVKYIKLYGPSVLLGTASVACILGSHHILSKRNAALAAAYTTLDKSFKGYRNRVIERFGKELDRELRYNIKAKEVEEIITAEDGTESVVKNTVKVADDFEVESDYARFFDDGCKGWTKDSECNLLYLKAQQAYANDLLKARGHVFLNEIYDMLGIPRTKMGAVVGWIYDKDNAIGDNYIDFGIYNVDRERNRAFVNGLERTILLDFNVDGNILDMI